MKRRLVVAAATAAAAVAAVFVSVSAPRSAPLRDDPPPAALTGEASPAPAEPIRRPKPEILPAPPPPPVVIAVAGDVLTGERIGPRIEAGEYGSVLDEETATLFREADIAVVNLETSVSERGSPADKTYTFRSPPENLAFLRDYLGIDAVSLANNHTLDYGRDAFRDTLEHTRRYGMAPFGAGGSLAEAAAPYIAEAGRLKIAFFASNQILPAASWAAGADTAGQLVTKDPGNLGALADGILSARETCDYIIVYMHWGIERDTLPNDVQKRTARALIDLGADIVIGAHPHVIQSFEYYNGKPIAYSLGNFIFNSRNPETAALFITLDGGEVSLRVVPCKMNGTLTYAAGEEDARALLEKWSGLSRGCEFTPGGELIETPAAE
ncbi:MAG: CapA family protein [Oscillospiraceae bacterium]|jgi:poly-gamma-glutamate synthesis protein (capsule biosynthesis protein)|nr:CapA family protein [Oscillospiraceae bacterium]